jgi:predicted ABC-type ATPase
MTNQRTTILPDTFIRIDYYQSRLEFIKDLFLTGNREILLENSTKIRTLIAQYQQFKDDPKYSPVLPRVIETFLG